MRACVRPEIIAIGLLAVLVASSGCRSAATGGQFEISDVQARWASGRLDIRCEQTLSLSEVARTALGNGVPLTVELDLVLRSAAGQARLARKRSDYEIRYLPMSEHYQVSSLADGQVRTYPRLRHALAGLGRIELSIDTGAIPAGDYELLARARLDRGRMPPPMRLPVLFDSQWAHASPWTSWPLVIDPES
jgi:hypothetical protein